MARMHTRRRGKSGSRRPLGAEKPTWSPLSAKEVEETVVKLHGEGLSTAAIGLRLRDQYGVPNVRLHTGKSLLQILNARGAAPPIPEDLQAMLRRAVRLQVHLKTHAFDHHTRRGLHLTEAKIRRLAGYYKGEGVLPADWDYAAKSAELLAQ